MKNRELREKLVRLLLFAEVSFEKSENARCLLLGALTDEEFNLIMVEPFTEELFSWYKWNKIFKKFEVLWGNKEWEYEIAEMMLGYKPKQVELTKQYTGYLKHQVGTLYKEKEQIFRDSLLW